jgi:hypothetical protein
MKTNRDDFSKGTKEILAKRVGYLCSNTTCRKPTIGANEDFNKATIIGIASHITAASKGGPRYNELISQEQRRHYSNGIWLCSNCAGLIDKDPSNFSIILLENWKTQAEVESAKKLRGEIIEHRIELPVLDVDLRWGGSIRANQGYSPKNPKQIIDGIQYIDITGTPIIYWSISRQFTIAIYNNSKFPAFNIKIQSIGERHFEELEELSRINNIPSLQKVDIKGKFKDNIEGIHSVADEIMKAFIPEKLKDIEIRITYYNEAKEKFVNLIQFTKEGLQNIKL